MGRQRGWRQSRRHDMTSINPNTSHCWRGGGCSTHSFRRLLSRFTNRSGVGRLRVVLRPSRCRRTVVQPPPNGEQRRWSAHLDNAGRPEALDAAASDTWRLNVGALGSSREPRRGADTSPYWVADEGLSGLPFFEQPTWPPMSDFWPHESSNVFDIIVHAE